MKIKNLMLFVFSFFTIVATPEPRDLSYGNFGTHITPLICLVLNTSGPILELGIGDFSTPILHEICKKSKRLLVSVDSNASWVSHFKDLATDWHKLEVTQNWDETGLNVKKWSIVFVDHAPALRRIVDIKRLRSKADIMIIHDSEAPANPVYQYEPYLSTFKYKYTYKRYTTETTVVSDTIDVAKYFDNN